MPPERDTIAFVQPFVPSYRVGLFDAIAAELDAHDLDLEVWHDEPKGIVAARRNSASGPWSVPTRQRRLTVRRRNVTVRPITKRARSMRAVVAGLASSNLETYPMALDPRVTLMLWGHGRNFTAGNNPLDRRLETWLCGRATHIFTYTQQGAEHVAQSGIATDKISVVRNSTDTARLRRGKAGVTPAEVSAMRQAWGVAVDDKVALFVGALDEPKRLPFLFAATDELSARMPNFVLVIAGAGPLDSWVAEQASTRPYIRLVGRLETDELARHANLVDVLVMPGRVGLVAVDSLALGIPLVTTDYPFHAPEADYLSSDNSITTENTESGYAAGLEKTLADPALLAALSEAALRDGDAFSVEQSAAIFAAGILAGISGR